MGFSDPKPKFDVGDAVYPNIDMKHLDAGIGVIRKMEWEYNGNPNAWFYYVRFRNSNETSMWIIESALQRVAGV